MKTFLRRWTLLLGSIAACSLVRADDPPKKDSGFGQGNMHQLTDDAYHKYLDQCPENEIHCLWFYDGKMNVGVGMTLDLKNWTVETFEWGAISRSRHPIRGLTRYQVGALMETIAELPASTPSITFSGSVHISFWRDKKLRTVDYDRQTVPRIVQRLYDVGGAELDFKYGKERSTTSP